MATDKKLNQSKRRTIVKLYISRVSKGYSSAFVIRQLINKYGVSSGYIYRLLRNYRKTELCRGATQEV